VQLRRPTRPHAWGKSRKGKNVVRQMTAKRRFARSLAAVKAWCRTNRHRPAREQRAWLSAVLVGHYAYYGITGNIWAATAVSLPSHEDLAQVAGTSNARKDAPMG
jgi:hypothetical protein